MLKKDISEEMLSLVIKKSMFQFMKSNNLFLTFLFVSLFSLGQDQVIDLAKLYKENKLISVNRTVSIVNDDKGEFLKVSEAKDQGLIWLPVNAFTTGKIIIEMRGKDVIQKSFIGVAFHAKNDTTYDAVYCRPFNFHASDSVRRIHAIQYISHPVYTWKYLRDNNNAVFEKEIKNAPDPNDWFEMTLVINKTSVDVFINDSNNPVLRIAKLSSIYAGKIGLYVGDNSGADFRKLSISSIN